MAWPCNPIKLEWITRRLSFDRWNVGTVVYWKLSLEINKKGMYRWSKDLLHCPEVLLELWSDHNLRITLRVTMYHSNDMWSNGQMRNTGSIFEEPKTPKIAPSKCIQIGCSTY